MIWESALGSAIEVAIAIAGFSGIVAAVGRRSDGHWTEPDQFRLRVLLTASGSALGLSFLPFILIGLVDSSTTWRLASGLQAAYMAMISTYRVRQASVAGIGQAIGLRPGALLVQTSVIALLVANAIWWVSSSLYLFGIAWSLTFAFSAFVRLLLGSWKELGEAQPQPSES